MDLDSSDLSNLRLLNIEEVDVMGGCVDDRVKQHGISNLSMEPN